MKFSHIACGLMLLGSQLFATQKPNIILVLVDDMGWGDTSLNAASVDGAPKAPVIHTPCMESIAKEGAQLRRHYTAAPVCAPARASLFFGVHQGHAESVRNNNFDVAAENSHSLASVLKAAGYSTALIGKWGIGGGMESGGTPETAAAWPTKRGFDYFFGYNNHLAGHRHYPKEESNADPETHCNAIWDGDKIITEQLDKCYSTDLFTARAKQWIIDHEKNEAQKPFFLALTLIAPHARLALPSAPYPKGGGLKGGLKWLGKPGKMINSATGEWDSFVDPQYRNAKAWEPYAKKRYGDRAASIIQGEQRHATMISRVDRALGDIIQLCKDLKIDKNTFIVFTSDNGPHDEPGAVPAVAGHPCPSQNPSFFRSYGAFDGIKRDTWEGGLRVPCLVYAPGQIKRGMLSKRPSQFQDWMATFAELAGVPKPMRCDGVSLLPELQGKGSRQDSTVYSEYAFNGPMAQFQDYADNKKGRLRGEQQIILFAGKGGKMLKAIRSDIKTGKEDFEIYDVDADTHESKNLAAQYADKQEELKRAVLYQRRAFDYKRDPACGQRRNPCAASRNYDKLLVPPNEGMPSLQNGLQMRQVQASSPWVPEFDSLPEAAGAKRSHVADLAALELPAGSISELKGYIRIPEQGQHWHFHLRMDAVEGSKAYVKMHNFQLIDADANYKPGESASESAAANTVEGKAGESGKLGIPLQAGLHEISIVLVQGPSAPGHVQLEWNKGPAGKEGPKTPIPAAAFSCPQ